MHRQPLADQLPYRFQPPRLNPLGVRASRLVRSRLLRREHRVEEIDIAGVEHLAPLLAGGDGVLITPNHSDRADGLVLFALGDQVGHPFCYMAAYQTFSGTIGLRHWLFPRLGIFPVDREGSDLKAFKAAVEILARGRNPLVLFPEGEVYHLADRLTPLREGAAAIALAAARRLGEAGRTVWVVPAALKYRCLEGHNPLPALGELMADLEARFTWWPDAGRPLVERIYRYAEGMLALKELEYFGAAQAGPIPERLVRLRSQILDGLEDRLVGRRRSDPVPVRVKELRRTCLDALADPETSPERAGQLRRDLNDLFVVLQVFSYAGDYAREHPTLERVAEILMKFEEDSLGIETATARGPRRAVLRLGKPIDVRDHLGPGVKPRSAAPALTVDLEGRIQALLDAIGPGQPIEPSAPAEGAGPSSTVQEI